MSTTKPPDTQNPTQGTPTPRPPGDWRARLPFYYGWLIVAASFASLGFTYTVWYSFSVFYVALIEDFGWSRASSAGVFSLFVMVSGLAGAGTGALADRFGPGRIISLGSIVLTVGLLACSQISDLTQFYLFFGILSAAGLSATGWIPVVTMINRWFYLKLGGALGVASSGIGVGILVMVPISQMVITQYGWRTAYMVLAGVVFFGVFPISSLIMRGKPEDLGLKRDGLPLNDQREAPAAATQAAAISRVVDRKWASREWTVFSAMGTSRYWLLFATLATANIATQMVFVHQVAYLVDGGYDKLLAASIVGVVGFFSIIAKAGWGWVSDRLGREVTWTMGLSCTLVGILLLIALRTVPFPEMVYLFAMVFAFGYGATAPLTPAAAADLFSGRHFGAVYGTLGVANSIGSATGAWLAGYIFDLTGNYVVAFFVGAGCCILSIAGMWKVAPRLVRRVPGRR